MGSIKNKAIVYAALIALVFSVTSCSAPATKEAYIEQFERFVDNVKQNHQDYNKSDWNYADERFQKFSKEWHEQFKDELTVGEELKVAGLIVRYESYKGVNKLKEFYDDVLKEDTEKMKEKIKYYIDNDMDEDLEKLKEGAKEIGDSTLKVVEDIIEKLDKRF